MLFMREVVHFESHSVTYLYIIPSKAVVPGPWLWRVVKTLSVGNFACRSLYARKKNFIMCIINIWMNVCNIINCNKPFCFPQGPLLSKICNCLAFWTWFLVGFYHVCPNIMKEKCPRAEVVMCCRNTLAPYQNTLNSPSVIPESHSG